MTDRVDATIPAEAIEAMLPPGTHRPSEDELRLWAEALRWDRNSVSMDSAWVTEHEFRIIRLPGRELWMTPVEWAELTGEIAAGAAVAERERLTAVISPKQFRMLAQFADPLGAEVQRALGRFADLLAARPGDTS